MIKDNDTKIYNNDFIDFLKNETFNDMTQSHNDCDWVIMYLIDENLFLEYNNVKQDIEDSYHIFGKNFQKSFYSYDGWIDVSSHVKSWKDYYKKKDGSEPIMMLETFLYFIFTDKKSWPYKIYNKERRNLKLLRILDYDHEKKDI
jgi:hypothetical protein